MNKSWLTDYFSLWFTFIYAANNKLSENFFFMLWCGSIIFSWVSRLPQTMTKDWTLLISQKYKYLLFSFYTFPVSRFHNWGETKKLLSFAIRLCLTLGLFADDRHILNIDGLPIALERFMFPKFTFGLHRLDFAASSVTFLNLNNYSIVTERIELKCPTKYCVKIISKKLT